MKLSRQEVIPRLEAILNRIKYNSGVYVEKNYDIPLTGNIIGFNEYDLIYLVVEIADEFGVFIEKDDVENYHFNTINNILSIICSKDI